MYRLANSVISSRQKTSQLACSNPTHIKPSGPITSGVFCVWNQRYPTAMPDDPTGMLETLAEADQVMVPLSPRKAKIAAGLALVRDGMPIQRAAKHVDIPTATLWRHARGLSDVNSEKLVQVNEQALVAASFDMAQIAASKLTDRLLDEDHGWKDGDLVKVYGVATDKIAMRRGWSKGQQANGDDHGMTTLARLLSGTKLTIEDADPVEQAIEVDAITSTDDAE